MIPMMNGVEERLHTASAGDYDLIVAGGGMAGVCAAAAARRTGVKRVLILEKSILLGGLATQGLVSLYEPMSDGYGSQISFGMAEELLSACMEYSPERLPPEWNDPGVRREGGARVKTLFSPAVMCLVLDRIVKESGADVLFDARAVRPVMEGTVCRGVIVESEEGRRLYTARAVIDATGSAAVFHQAGAPCVDGDNYMTCLSYRTSLAAMREAVESGEILRAREWFLQGSTGPTGCGHPEGMRYYRGTTAREITEFVMAGRKILMDAICGEDRMLRDITVLPAMPQFRAIRHIRGARTVQPEDANRACADSVGAVADFKEKGKWFEIPYGSMYVPGFPNLLAAGRITAAEGWAWSCIRVIPGVAVTGQAAGTAAALCLENRCGAEDLPVKLLQESLEKQAARIHAGLPLAQGE